jgi:hypothetical protein
MPRIFVSSVVNALAEKCGQPFDDLMRSGTGFRLQEGSFVSLKFLQFVTIVLLTETLNHFRNYVF